MRREALRRVHRRVVVGLRGVDRGAEGRDAVALYLRGVARNEDRRVRAEVLGRVGDAESVIAGRRRDDAAGARIEGKSRQHVQRAAQLERARDLPVLELEVDVAPGNRTQLLAAHERCATDQRSDSVGGRDDVGGS